MTDDPGRNEFDVLLQRTRRISIGSPTYPEAVGIKWAASELDRMEAENAALKEDMDSATGTIAKLQIDLWEMVNMVKWMETNQAAIMRNQDTGKYGFVWHGADGSLDGSMHDEDGDTALDAWRNLKVWEADRGPDKG